MRPGTLIELAEARDEATAAKARSLLHESAATARSSRSLSECFQIFGLIHNLINDLPSLRRVTREALADFHADGCVYVELRTTPRTLSDGTSPRSYVRTVVEEIRAFNSSCNQSFGACLLLSIDRAQDRSQATEAVNLALEFISSDPEIVVGIDVSGNPTRGSFSDILPALTAARKACVPITVHCAEIENGPEVDAILSFKPERLGHALVLSDSQVGCLLSMSPRPPIELCPTSNMKTLALVSMSHHPTAKRWVSEGYPFSINTDDSGVFATNSSVEYFIFSQALGLGMDTLAKLNCDIASHAFCSELVKESVRKFIGRKSDRLLMVDRFTLGLY